MNLVVLYYLEFVMNYQKIDHYNEQFLNGMMQKLTTNVSQQPTLEVPSSSASFEHTKELLDLPLHYQSVEQSFGHSTPKNQNSPMVQALQISECANYKMSLSDTSTDPSGNEMNSLSRESTLADLNLEKYQYETHISDNIANQINHRQNQNDCSVSSKSNEEGGYELNVGAQVLDEINFEDSSENIANGIDNADSSTYNNPPNNIKNISGRSSTSNEISRSEKLLPRLEILRVSRIVKEIGKYKKHWCPFCYTGHTKLVRHLQLQHRDELEVKNFMVLRRDDKKRKDIIKDLRKRGDYYQHKEGFTD